MQIRLLAAVASLRSGGSDRFHFVGIGFCSKADSVSIEEVCVESELVCKAACAEKTGISCAGYAYAASPHGVDPYSPNIGCQFVHSGLTLSEECQSDVCHSSCILYLAEDPSGAITGTSTRSSMQIGFDLTDFERNNGEDYSCYELLQGSILAS